MCYCAYEFRSWQADSIQTDHERSPFQRQAASRNACRLADASPGKPHKCSWPRRASRSSFVPDTTPCRGNHLRVFRPPRHARRGTAADPGRVFPSIATDRAVSTPRARVLSAHARQGRSNGAGSTPPARAFLPAATATGSRCTSSCCAQPELNACLFEGPGVQNFRSDEAGHILAAGPLADGDNPPR